MVQVAHQDQVLAPGQQVVDGRELAGDADRRAHRVRLAHRVVPGHAQRPAVGGEQRREDRHDRGLAGAVGPEQRVDASLGDGEVDPVEDDVVAVGLAQAGSGDGEACHRGLRMTTLPSAVRARTSTPPSAGRAGGREQVLHAPGRRVDVQVGGGALGDADLDVADRGLENDRAAHDLPQPHVAVGRLGHDVALGAVDGEAAVGRVEPQLPAGHADPRVAVGVLDHGTARQLAHADVARARRELRGAGGALDVDVPRPALEVERVGLPDADLPEAVLDPAVAERAGAHEVRQLPAGLQARARRQLDRHRDRPAGAAGIPGAGARRRHRQAAARALHAGLLGGLDVLLVGRVARAHLDDGGVALGGGEPQLAEDQADRRGDRPGRLERHRTHPL